MRPNFFIFPPLLDFFLQSDPLQEFKDNIKLVSILKNLV